MYRPVKPTSPDVTDWRGIVATPQTVAVPRLPPQFRRRLINCKCHSLAPSQVGSAGDAGDGSTMCCIANGVIILYELAGCIEPSVRTWGDNATRRLKGEQRSMIQYSGMGGLDQKFESGDKIISVSSSFRKQGKQKAEVCRRRPIGNTALQ